MKRGKEKDHGSVNAHFLEHGLAFYGLGFFFFSFLFYGVYMNGFSMVIATDV